MPHLEHLRSRAARTCRRRVARFAPPALTVVGVAMLSGPVSVADDLVLWGRVHATNPGRLVEPISVAAGIDHTAIVEADGRVVVRGNNDTDADGAVGPADLTLLLGAWG